MNYPASFQDFFKSPKWTMNLLLAAVCCLIPIVGPMVVIGWLLNGFWGRNEGRPETFPEFSFDHFGKNLERGLWPTLVGIVVSLVTTPVLIIIMFMGMFVVGGAASAGGENVGGGIAILGTIVMGLLFVAFAVAVAFVMTPVVLRAALLQDFGAAFNMPFVKRFLSLVKNELAISMLVLGAVGCALVVIIMVPCINAIVIIAVMPLLKFAWSHLTKQLYQLYLSRGGEPLTISPKLTDDLPPAPPAAPLPPAA